MARPKLSQKSYSERTSVPISRLLVVGCGSGVEAAILARELSASVVGVDLEANFDPAAAGLADLRYGDATALEFEDGAFDFVFSLSCTGAYS